MIDVSTQEIIAQYLDKRDEWDALQEVTVELEQAEARIEELEVKLAELLVVVKRAVRLSLDHSDFNLYAMEPLQRAIDAVERKRTRR